MPSETEFAIKVPVRACAVCGGQREGAEVLRTMRFVLAEGHPLTDGYDVVCCKTCGFVYADTGVTQAEYDRFYQEHSKYQDGKTSTGAGEAPYDRKRLDDTADCIVGYLKNSKARVLDIGCANGGLLKSLAARGYTQLMGLDPSPACVEHAGAIAGVEAMVGTLEAVPEKFGNADLVVLSHVFEHVRDLKTSLEAIGGLLAPGGAVYIEVPDASHYADIVPAPFQDFSTEHINHFSLVSLANLMRGAGYKVKQEGEKKILSPPPYPFPACFGFYVKSEKPGKIEFDHELRERILAYIEISERMMNDMDKALREALPAGESVIVWGVGQLSMKLLVDSVLGTVPIAAFVDGNPIHRGTKIRGVEVRMPEDIQGLTHPIVVGSTLHQEAIVATIQGRLRLPNRIIRLAPDLEKKIGG